jgi:protein TonB
MTMAIALHAAVILGVGFILALPKGPSSTRMDITLSHYKSDKKIYDADYVAQTNQEASGSESQKKELTTTELAPINSSEIKQFNPEVSMAQKQSSKANMQVVSTESISANKVSKKKTDKEQEAEKLKSEVDKLQRELEMASLQAKLDKEQQVYARLPRVRRASSVATKAAEDAEYLYHWQRRIETIGNQNYPAQSREQQIYGDVQVLVVVDSSGKLDKVELLSSSGHKLLDDAALKIVRLSSPFKPFTAEMKKSVDKLEIIRTWQFQKNRFSKQ